MALRNLSLGLTDVTAVQEALSVWQANPALRPDRNFCPKTDMSVRRFQRAHRLKDDGIVGRKMRAALFPVGVATTTIYGMRLTLPNFSPPRGRSSTLLRDASL